MADQDTNSYSRLRDLGPALSGARRKLGKAQAELAADAAVSRANLSRYETGAEVPQPRTLDRLLEALETDLGALMRQPVDELAEPSRSGEFSPETPDPAAALRVILRYEGELAAREARIAELEARVRHLEANAQT